VDAVLEYEFRVSGLVPPDVLVEIEGARVVVEPVQTRNGVRLRISVPASGHQILLCPLELEALSWQDHEFFTKLLATPHGPEEP
jgi:hypothetical protein